MTASVDDDPGSSPGDTFPLASGPSTGAEPPAPECPNSNDLSSRIESFKTEFDTFVVMAYEGLKVADLHIVEGVGEGIGTSQSTMTAHQQLRLIYSAVSAVTISATPESLDPTFFELCTRRLKKESERVGSKPVLSEADEKLIDGYIGMRELLNRGFQEQLFSLHSDLNRHGREALKAAAASTESVAAPAATVIIRDPEQF